MTPRKHQPRKFERFILRLQPILLPVVYVSFLEIMFSGFIKKHSPGAAEIFSDCGIVAQILMTLLQICTIHFRLRDMERRTTAFKKRINEYRQLREKMLELHGRVPPNFEPENN